MTSRATASIARPDGRVSSVVMTAASSASMAVAWARATSRYTSRSRRLRVADEQGPGHVAAVAGDLRAEVEQQDRAHPNRSVSRRAVRQRRLGAAQAGHVEGQRLRSAGPHPPLEVEGELGLGHARPDARQQPRQRPVGHGTRRGDALDLGRLLDRPVRLDPALDRDELDVGRRGRKTLPRRPATRTRPRRRPGVHRPSPRAPASATAGRRRPPRCGPPGPHAGPGRCSASRRARRPRRRRRGTVRTCRRPSPHRRRG